VASSPSSVTTPAVQNAGLTTTKTSPTASFSAVGEVIGYSIRVANTGNVTLTGVAVSDPKAVLGVCAPTALPGDLAPGESTTCAASHTVTQVDLDAGAYLNTATSSGTGPAGLVTSAPSSVTTPGSQSPAIGLVKTSSWFDTNGDGLASAGDEITYTLIATNTGNVSLRDVSVSDPLLPGLACTVAVLAPSKDLTCTATYRVTAADVAAGSVVNTAAATGADPSGAVLSVTATRTSVLTAQPALTLTKTATLRDRNGDRKGNPGEMIDYLLVATNTGNVTLPGVTITDPMLATLTCTPALGATLSPGEAMRCTGSHTVTTADAAKGTITNVATARARPTCPRCVAVLSSVASATLSTSGVKPLPRTGATAIPAIKAGIPLILLGILLLAAARPRRRHHLPPRA